MFLLLLLGGAVVLASRPKGEPVKVLTNAMLMHPLAPPPPPSTSDEFDPSNSAGKTAGKEACDYVGLGVADGVCGDVGGAIESGVKDVIDHPSDLLPWNW